MSAAEVVKRWDCRNWSDDENRNALKKLRHACQYLNRRSLSSEFGQADADAQAILDAACQTLSEAFSEELFWRALPRGEDR